MIRLRCGLTIAAQLCLALVCATVSAQPAPPEHPAPPTALKRITLGAERSLPLSIVSTGRCMFGDYDLMASDLNSAKTPSIILTIEPLPQGKPLAAASLFEQGVGGKILKGGYALEISLPPDMPDQLLGLYLCRDSLATGRCSDKPVLPFADALKPYTDELPKDYEAADKVYFFAFIVVKGRELYFRDQLMTDQATAALPSQVRKLLGPGGDGDAYSRIEMLSKVIGSEPLKAGESGRLVLDLPHLDQQRCGGR